VAINLNTGVARNFIWGGERCFKMEKNCDVFRWCICDDVTEMTLFHHNCFFKFDFVIISLKNTIWLNHATADHQYRKFMGLGTESPQRLAIFENLQQCFFDMSPQKFSLKIWNLFIISI